jgi:SOS-response transcriptional repressor LexA
MTGKIDHKDMVTVEPLNDDPKVGDIVLCKVRGAHYLHLVKAVKGDEYLIGNNKGGTNGWTGRQHIFGLVTKVEK